LKEQEKIFFRMRVRAFILKNNNEFYKMTVHDLIYIIQQLFCEKQCLYYLNKWYSYGFYDCGVALDLGWFNVDKLLGEYKTIYERMKGENIV
jgi:hypothetical protein